MAVQNSSNFLFSVKLNFDQFFSVNFCRREGRVLLLSSVTGFGWNWSENSKNNLLHRNPAYFIGDATRLWSSAPNGIRKAKTIRVAKKRDKNLLQKSSYLIGIVHSISRLFLIYKSNPCSLRE